MSSDFARYVDEIECGLTEQPEGLSAISSADLAAKEIPPLREIVPGLITQGLTILGSPPKYGKSFMVLDLCLSVSSGDLFLGFRTNRCGCFYLALEDSERRLKNRQRTLLEERTAPSNCYFTTAAKTTDTGLFDELSGFLAKHPDVGLVVIDTLQKVRGSTFGRDGSYAADYKELGLLKAFADEKKIALVLVHHLRKMGDDADPFNRISGTAAVSGAADSMIVLSKEKRSSETATLTATGRDIDGMEIELSFDKATCRWRNLGDTEALKEQRVREEYETNPIVVTIRCLIGQSQDSTWTGRAQDLMEAGRYFTHSNLASSNKALGAELSQLDGPFMEYDRILHTTKSGGTGGKIHRFEYQSHFAELTSQEEIRFS